MKVLPYRKPATGFAILLLLAACSAGPDYRRPAIETPQQFTENAGWIKAAPHAQAYQGEWWTVFGDEELNRLEQRLLAANQSLRASFFAYQQALALADSSRSGEFPTVTANVSSTRSANATAAVAGGGTAAVYSGQSVGISASWVPDLWGKVRRQVESNEASAAASHDTLLGAQLSLQSTLAQNYFQLRQLDSQIVLAHETESADARALQLTQSRYAAGVASRADVAQSRQQLSNVRVQLMAYILQRKQLEHAIAVLIGEQPSNFSLSSSPLLPQAQAIPVGVPAQLLLRRPDLLAAERQVAAANAQIGVAESAYFPALTLSAQGGYRSANFPGIIDASNLFWSAGPALALTLFDGGSRRAAKAQAQNAYQQTVAQYRQLSLQAIQQVEDQLAAMSTLAAESKLQQQAVEAAESSLHQTELQYQAGIVSRQNLIVAQTSAYAARNSAIQTAGQQLIANVVLIQALGGATTEDAPAAEAAVAGQ